ncbi:ecdysone-induced protein 74EF isoform B [Caerostris extrusa]|uniref:Ecdysone-induced protein 74EF isoform B n=1 Tax=Caerostris extrusa TaxID=172846 RepID=A0AAV4TEB8_CAEEX|nr:ecdysone-induced protein 74EF isoform B [Caerostris extrusa]
MNKYKLYIPIVSTNGIFVLSVDNSCDSTRGDPRDEIVAEALLHTPENMDREAKTLLQNILQHSPQRINYSLATMYGAHATGSLPQVQQTVVCRMLTAAAAISVMRKQNLVSLVLPLLPPGHPNPLVPLACHMLHPMGQRTSLRCTIIECSKQGRGDCVMTPHSCTTQSSLTDKRNGSVYQNKHIGPRRRISWGSGWYSREPLRSPLLRSRFLEC